MRAILLALALGATALAAHAPAPAPAEPPGEDKALLRYLTQVARVNIVTMAALASAPAPPRNLVIEGAVSPDTTLKWSAIPGAAG